MTCSRHWLKMRVTPPPPLCWTLSELQTWENTLSFSCSTGETHLESQIYEPNKSQNVGDHESSFRLCRFTSAVVYQGLIMRVGIAGGNVYIDFLISGLVEFPAAFLILITIERIGRRLPFAAANIVAGAACVITAFIPDSKDIFSPSQLGFYLFPFFPQLVFRKLSHWQ